MKTMMTCVIIVIIVSIIDTALVDCVCICHLRKAMPPIRLLSPDTLPIDSQYSLPIWVVSFQDDQAWKLLDRLADFRRRFCSQRRPVSVIWVALDLLLACLALHLSPGGPYTRSPALHRPMAALSLVSQRGEDLCRAPMNLCRAAYMGHGWAS